MKMPGSTANATGLPSASPPQPSQPTNATPTVQFDVSNLQSSYANVCNVSSTREEVVLAFGVNNCVGAGAGEYPGSADEPYRAEPLCGEAVGCRAQSRGRRI